MVLWLEIYAVIITVLFLISFFLFILYKKQIYTLKKKIKFLNVRDTHIRLTSNLPSEDVAGLVNAINDLLMSNENIINNLEQHENSVKETITNVSHDLRTPLTAIRGYSQMLLSSDELGQEEREIVEIIVERSNVLNQLLNQLFVFARIEADEIELSFDRMDLNAVLRSTLVSFYQTFEKQNIEPLLDIPEVPFPFLGDENALARIFSNILSNALIHGSGNYKVSSYVKNSNYVIRFENTARDIEVSDLDKIFDRFYTTDKSRSKKTTGLGLAISKKMVEKMSGSIHADLNNNVFSVIVQFPVMENITKKGE